MKSKLIVFAVAVIILPATAKAQYYASVENIRKHVEILASDSLCGRGFGSREIKMAVDYITSQYALAGISPLNDSLLYPFDALGKSGNNIVGYIKGTDPELQNEYIVLGAHYDHLGKKVRNGDTLIYNGADDNASGVAVMLEAGRILSMSEPKRSILLIAFDGEEAGLLGSEAFVANPPVPLKSIKLMFSLDMVGVLDKNQGIILKGLASLEHCDQCAVEIAEKTGITIRSKPDGIEQRTDTWPFAMKKIPAVHITTGTKYTPYHKPADDCDSLDYAGMTSIADFIASFVLKLSSQEKMEANKRLINHAVDPKIRAGIKTSAGTSHHEFVDAFYRAKTAVALETGVVSQIKLSRLLYLQPAVTYSLYGSDSETGSFHFHSVEPACDMVLMTPSSKSIMPRMYIGIGGYYRYNFAATQSWKAMDFSALYTNEDAGLHAVLGYQVMNVQVAYELDLGLTNISLDPTGPKIQNRSFYFSTVIFF